MTPFAALFPGQLSEKAGMGEKLARAYPYVKSFLAEVGARSGVDLPATYFGEGSPSLHDDLPAQVGVFAVSVAVLDVMEREHGVWPAAAAGYSLGTYAAFVAAGALDRWGALTVLLEVERLLRVHRPDGGMGFVIGLPLPDLELEIARISKAGDLSIANRNAPQQLVVTGRGSALDRLLAAVGPRALRAGRLPVSWPMHAASLEPVAGQLAEFVASRVSVSNPSRSRLFAPMLGREVASAGEAAEVLARQVAAPSNWEGTLRALSASGFGRFAEVGPGDVLARMLRWTLRRAHVGVMEDPESTARFVAGLEAA